ncbi:MAG: twin-arginine translocase TatA/TatE family subunit [Salinivirgaceae bacterium]|nr:twin-arginine translocase TatA/TatE family subunit [Salinivirgaceae bacterium]
MLGGPEIILIVLAILILFGGKKIPELMKGLGKGIKEFKNVTSDSEIGKEINDIKKEINSVTDNIKNSTKL